MSLEKQTGAIDLVIWSTLSSEECFKILRKSKKPPWKSELKFYIVYLLFAVSPNFQLWYFQSPTGINAEIVSPKKGSYAAFDVAFKKPFNLIKYGPNEKNRLHKSAALFCSALFCHPSAPHSVKTSMALLRFSCAFLRSPLRWCKSA